MRQISISSNPFREIKNRHARIRIAFFLGGQDPLNGFIAKPFELNVSKRIKDPWYSTRIDECRAGNLSDEKYNYLHGYPHAQARQLAWRYGVN